MKSSQFSRITDELLSAYLDNDLSQQDRDLIEAAIATDDEVAWRLESLRQTIQLLSNLPELAPKRSFVLDESMVGDITSARRQAAARRSAPGTTRGTGAMGAMGMASITGQETTPLGTRSGTAPTSDTGAGHLRQRLRHGWRNFWQQGNPMWRNLATASLVLAIFVASADTLLTQPSSPASPALVQMEQESLAAPAADTDTAADTQADTQADAQTSPASGNEGAAAAAMSSVAEEPANEESSGQESTEEATEDAAEDALAQESPEEASPEDVAEPAAAARMAAPADDTAADDAATEDDATLARGAPPLGTPALLDEIQPEGQPDVSADAPAAEMAPLTFDAEDAEDTEDAESDNPESARAANVAAPEADASEEETTQEETTQVGATEEDALAEGGFGDADVTAPLLLQGEATGLGSGGAGGGGDGSAPPIGGGGAGGDGTGNEPARFPPLSPSAVLTSPLAVAASPATSSLTSTAISITGDTVTGYAASDTADDTPETPDPDAGESATDESANDESTPDTAVADESTIDESTADESTTDAAMPAAEQPASADTDTSAATIPAAPSALGQVMGLLAWLQWGFMAIAITFTVLWWRTRGD